ncbi:MAG: acetylpolyamine amidohydrolase [Candidatus Marinimicrobia bacterium]|nr:acetylpolyamine amidohydrolase [Candidatus Neomarinimicrobiota bacterium]
MIRIVRVHSTALPADQQRAAAVQQIFRANFAAVAAYADKIPSLLDEPFRFGYRTVLLVSEGSLGKVTGFSLFLHLPEIDASLLDFMAVDRAIRGGGIGSALYEATREYLKAIGSRGLYFESLPADPQQVPDPVLARENRRRLSFYARYGAHPIEGTAYETPVDESPAPHLLFDGLDRAEPLGRAEAQTAVGLILRRKYSHLVTPAYIRTVVASFTDDPVRLRTPPRRPAARPIARPADCLRLALVSSTVHEIHHVAERGYVERPARIRAMLGPLTATGLFVSRPPQPHGEQPIRAVHPADFVTYLKTVCEKNPPLRPVYPYVFPLRRAHRPPRELAVRAGYFCMDTFTPLDRNAYRAARAAVDVTLTAADEILRHGHVAAFALTRPPGHHAERRVFGGFCYFNNAAIAAQRFSAHGRVAVLDIDFHHGNGAQDIFYRRADVLTLSLHGHPDYAYPYFSGFSDETGEGPGAGYNANYPLPEGTDETLYLATFERALARIRRFDPLLLVVPVGFDTLQGDPTGGFNPQPPTLAELGRRIAGLGRPVLFCQEGGYHLRNLRQGARALFTGFAQGWTSRIRHELTTLPQKPRSGLSPAKQRSAP